jgi:hypothetical protein
LPFPPGLKPDGKRCRAAVAPGRAGDSLDKGLTAGAVGFVGHDDDRPGIGHATVAIR